MEFTNSTTGVYTAEDDYGTSYYFRGNVTNNYVKFGKWTNEVYRGYSEDQSTYKDYFSKEECQNSQDTDWTAEKNLNQDCNKSPVAGKDMYWRIIRINGDGTLRLIYDGTEPHANGTKSLDRFAMPNQKFNADFTNNTDVGYMYGDPSGATYEEVHANTNDSLMKIALENWYEKNFVGTEYASKVGNMSFCNDRSLSSGTGIGKIETYYGAYGRIETNKSPSLVCPQKSNDLFTNNTTKGGNGKLKYPIGLLTADEAALVGGGRNAYNRGFYINKGGYYWLGSPYIYNSHAYEFGVYSFGLLYLIYTSDIHGAVPVINLSAKYANRLVGAGTMDNPYTVSDKVPETVTISFNYNSSYGKNWTSSECPSPLTFDSLTNTCTKEVVLGGKYGTLPVTSSYSTDDGLSHSYDGIWTTSSGGTQITEETIVDASSPRTLFVQWKSVCFAAGTLVYTPKGYKEIQNLKVGDEVYAYNEQTKLIDTKKITNTIMHNANAYYKVTFENGTTMKVTSGHQFYNPENGKWQAISEFKEGDALMNDNKERVIIKSIKVIHDTTGIKVYNFEVEDNHNYFVTKDNILTHNAVCSGAIIY